MQQGSFIARNEDTHHSAHGVIVKSKGSLMPLLGRFVKRGTGNAREVGVQPPAEGRRPFSGEPATRLFRAEQAVPRWVDGRRLPLAAVRGHATG